MKIYNLFFLLKNSILKKENLIVPIILSLIFIVVLACFATINFVMIYRNNSLESIHGRTLLISTPSSEEELKKIKDINHVELVESNKYMHDVEVQAKQFDRENAEGSIQLKPLLITDDIRIAKGKSLSENGDIVCPTKFYPHSIYNTEMKFYDSYLLNGKSLIGNQVRLVNYENDEFSLNVVGTFFNNPLDELGACYVLKEDFDNFKNNIEVCSDDECYEFNSLMLIINKYKNINNVEKELINMGVPSMRIMTIDEEMLAVMTYIPLLICGMVLVIAVCIIYSFFRKKSINNQYLYGVLKSVGYTNKDVISLAWAEGTLIYLFSIVFSFTIYVIFIPVIINSFLPELNYHNIATPIPWLHLLLFIIISLIYIIFIIKRLTKKSLNLCVRKLFER